MISHFGRANVFIDIDTISPGVDFEQRIREALDTCQLALILIGPRWLTLENPDGTRRIDAEDDLVKQEVAAGLNRPDVTVVPVLVEGASMPSAAELPPEIASLAKFNAFDLTTKRWQYDVGQLAQFARRYDKWWWRVVFRTPRLVLRAAPIVALAIAAIVAVAVASSGPDKAARIASCERTHGLPSAQATRSPRPGETEIAPSSSTSAPIYSQQTFASCSWPPPPGADPDGYAAITITSTSGAANGSIGSGQLGAERIESHCKTLQLAYTFGHTGTERSLPPFRASPGDIWTSPMLGASSFVFTRLGRIGTSAQDTLGLSFYPAPSEVVVLLGSETLFQAQCVA